MKYGILFVTVTLIGVGIGGFADYLYTLSGSGFLAGGLGGALVGAIASAMAHDSDAERNQ